MKLTLLPPTPLIPTNFTTWTLAEHVIGGRHEQVSAYVVGYTLGYRPKGENSANVHSQNERIVGDSHYTRGDA